MSVIYIHIFVVHVPSESTRSPVIIVLIFFLKKRYLMATEGIDAVVVGADRVVANGDTANKVHTMLCLCVCVCVYIYILAHT